MGTFRTKTPLARNKSQPALRSICYITCSSISDIGLELELELNLKLTFRKFFLTRGGADGGRGLDNNS